jgi:Clp amino terminal domain, pathogenicity island component
MFERFTDRARRVVVWAQEEARMLGHNHIGSEHLLLGLLHEQDGVAARVLERAEVTVEAARAMVTELAGPGDKSPGGHIPFTQRAKKILELSLREALEQQKTYIGTEHILLALMRDSDDPGAQILEQLGGPLPSLRQSVPEEVRVAGPDPAGQEEAEHRMWGRGWQYALALAREGRVPPQTVIGYRGLLAPIDRRLAGIERHLEISADEEPPLGFRGMLQSVDRRLARIERHLGISAGEADEGPEEAAGEAGKEGPAASAE